MSPRKPNPWPRAAVGMAALIAMTAASTAFAITAAELACCDEMDQAVQAYFQKHIKKVRRCTIKMDQSANPGAERCDDGFDATTGDTDYLVDVLETRMLKRMKRKCIRKLGLADEAALNAHGPMPSPCTCNVFAFLTDQMSCKLNLIPDPSDNAVCSITPAKKNANRGSSSPPGIAGFCP